VNAGVIPLAIATIGASYAALVLRGWRRRDNLVFGLLALTDAAMTAWRGINVLTGGSLIAPGVLVPCMVGTIVLAVFTLEFISAFPRRCPMTWPWRVLMLAWGAAGAVIAFTTTEPSSVSAPANLLAEVVVFIPATLLVFVLGARAFKHTQQRDARIVIGMLWFRWGFGCAAYWLGPLLGVFAAAVWAETTFATMVSFVVIGTAILRGELSSIRSSTAEVVTIATVALLVMLGGVGAVSAALAYVAPGHRGSRSARGLPGGLEQLVTSIGSEVSFTGLAKSRISATERSSRASSSSVEVLAVVVGQLQLLAQDLDVQRDAGQRRPDVVRDRGGELTERREPARVVQLGDRLRALDGEGDVRGQIARDDVGIAIDEPAVEVERADQDAIGAERGHDQVRRQIPRLVLAQRLADLELGGERRWQFGAGDPAHGRPVADRGDPAAGLGDRGRGVGRQRIALDAEPARAALVEPGQHAALDPRVQRVAQRGEGQRHQGRAEQRELLQPGCRGGPALGGSRHPRAWPPRASPCEFRSAPTSERVKRQTSSSPTGRVRAARGLFEHGEAHRRASPRGLALSPPPHRATHHLLCAEATHHLLCAEVLVARSRHRPRSMPCRCLKEPSE
jgi:hypothetical protein